ncbi:hypothetical protein L9W97_17980 [Vibrio aestuarianus]|uniref:hypothetical protein n=1 Tax=Vibrio aestuarianus TaxID=28171 RepID=UPI00237D0366|nr:hypothetical protein [Vibrio aestuarianus]MDE1327019.1 hypothetical protein [Vibrio aestuarianus]
MKDKSKVILAVLLLTALCILFAVYQEDVMFRIKWLLESSILKIGCIIFVIVSILCHSLFVPETELEDVPLFKGNQLAPLIVIANISTYVAISSTATTLLKAIYLQKFYAESKYFYQFENYDVNIMFAGCLVLLWFTLFNCGLLLKEAYNYSSSETPEKA